MVGVGARFIAPRTVGAFRALRVCYMTTVDKRPIPANTCKLLPERRKSTILSTLSVLCGILIGLRLLLPSVAFAFSRPNLKVVTTFQSPPSAPAIVSMTLTTPTAQTKNARALPDVFGVPNWLISIGGLVVLLVLLVLVSQTIARRGAQRRKECARFKAERQAADRRAVEDLLRQQQMPPSPASQPAPEQPAVQRPADVGQVQRPQAAQPAQRQQTLPISPVTQDAAVANKPNPTTQRPIAEQRCPNCGQLTRVGATYCPNCRFVLSPSLPSVSRQSLPITTPPSPVPEPASQREKVPALSGPQSLAQQAPIQAPVIGTKETDSAKAIQATLRRLWSQAER